MGPGLDGWEIVVADSGPVDYGLYKSRGHCQYHCSQFNSKANYCANTAHRVEHLAEWLSVARAPCTEQQLS